VLPRLFEVLVDVAEQCAAALGVLPVRDRLRILGVRVGEASAGEHVAVTADDVGFGKLLAEVLDGPLDLGAPQGDDLDPAGDALTQQAAANLVPHQAGAAQDTDGFIPTHGGGILSE